MYYNWLDRWDERRARRGDDAKDRSDFVLDMDRAFPMHQARPSIKAFCKCADMAVQDDTFWTPPEDNMSDFRRDADHLTFPSDLTTDVPNNNLVTAKITGDLARGHALIVFHHWNAQSRNSQLAAFFARCDVAVFEIALPYHLERNRPGSRHADYMLSPNLGRTIQSHRQAVWDGRKLIGWLRKNGFARISVLGMSLGSWVAGLVAAHDENVSDASLLLTAGSLADMVWTGRATHLIRQSLESEIDIADLNRTWGSLNLENYSEKLARSDLNLQLVLAKRDRVVPPDLSRSFIHSLDLAGGKPKVLDLNCGHYSLALPPHIICAGLSVRKQLKRNV